MQPSPASYYAVKVKDQRALNLNICYVSSFHRFVCVVKGVGPFAKG